MKVNAKYVNPFIEAAMKVVKQIAGIEVRRGHLSYKAKVEPSYGVSIIIGIYGFLVGQVVYSLDGSLAERMVDKLLGGKSPQEKKIMFVDTLGELANMITGNATALLNQSKDLSLKITTPAIATGEQPEHQPGAQAGPGAGAVHPVRAHRDQHRAGGAGHPVGDREPSTAVLQEDLTAHGSNGGVPGHLRRGGARAPAGMGSRPCWRWKHRPADRELLNQMFRGDPHPEGLGRLHRLRPAAAAGPRPGVGPAGGAGRGRPPWTPASIELLFRGLDLCRRMVEGFTAGQRCPEADAESLPGGAPPAGLRHAAAPRRQRSPARPRPPRPGAGRRPAAGRRFRSSACRCNLSGREGLPAGLPGPQPPGRHGHHPQRGPRPRDPAGLRRALRLRPDRGHGPRREPACGTA